ncbi:MAG: 1-acyl-sn-glycerol-3-phosphate acyltransferase [Terricaulis sp.]
MNSAKPILIDPATARPAPSRGFGAGVMHLLSATYLKLAGWSIQGDFPALDKAVLIAAPHTSNEDGILMLAAAGYYRVKLRWMGKASLARGVLGLITKPLGIVPIDRSSSHDVVKTMADAFAAARTMILAVPPEGTRNAVREWKSGFYHIAVAANVPLILSVLDYGTRSIRLAAVITPSGDYDADLALIRSFYTGAEGKHADKFVAG